MGRGRRERGHRGFLSSLRQQFHNYPLISYASSFLRLYVLKIDQFLKLTVTQFQPSQEEELLSPFLRGTSEGCLQVPLPVKADRFECPGGLSLSWDHTVQNHAGTVQTVGRR